MKRHILSKFFYIALFLSMPYLAFADQLSFSKIEAGENYQFNYQWLDRQGDRQKINFLLSKRAMFDRFRNFKIFKSEMAQFSINNALQKKLREEPIKGVMIDFKRNKNNEISIKGRSNQTINAAYAKINEMKQTLNNEYLTDNYYQQFITHDQINAIKPDHARFANIASIDLKPVKPRVLEKFSIKNIRKITNYILGFVQSIPYATLESRVTASGAGFNPPLKLLWENQGDCDSKVTLTAAIFRTLMPRIKMILVFIDNHALIGIEVPVDAEDQTINIDGVSYVLAEPTGPSLFNLGEIAQESKLAIGNGHYTAELFHAKKKTSSITETENKDTKETDEQQYLDNN
jgi:hypothetical protein